MQFFRGTSSRRRVDSRLRFKCATCGEVEAPVSSVNVVLEDGRVRDVELRCPVCESFRGEDVPASVLRMLIAGSLGDDARFVAVNR